MKRLFVGVLAWALLLAAGPVYAAAPPIPGANPNPSAGPSGTVQTSNGSGGSAGGVPNVSNGVRALTNPLAQTSGGSVYVALPNSNGAAIGDVLVGTSIPTADQVVAVSGGSATTRAASASFTSGQAVITFSGGTTGFVNNMVCIDTTNLGAIDPSNHIQGVGGTSITFSANLLQNSGGSADSITCYPTATLLTASSAAVALGATIADYPGGTAYATPGQLNLMGGFWASGASGIAGLSFSQAPGGGHNWGIGGAGNTFGAGVSSFYFRSQGSDTTSVFGLYAGSDRPFQVTGSSGTAGDVQVYAVTDNRLVLGANNAGVFEVAGGNSTGTGSFSRFICCHAVGDSNYLLNSPVNGATITLADGTNTYDRLYLTPAGTIAGLTIVLQPTPVDGQELTILSTQNVTALTLQAGAGTSLTLGAGLPTSLTANVPVRMICLNTTSTTFKCLSGNGGTWVPDL